MIADNSEDDEANNQYRIDPKVREKSKIGKQVKAMAEDIKKFRALLS